MSSTGGSTPEKWHHRWLWEPKLMYALNSCQGSAISNYLTVYYQQVAGFSKVQIGVLQTLPSVCMMLAPPIWGAIADHIGDQRLVHNLSIATGALLMFALQYFSWSYELTIVVLLAARFQSSPSGSLLDHAVLNMLEKLGGEYGKQRLFGAVGWGIGAYITGLAVAAAGISWAFNISIAFACMALLVLRLIPPVKTSHHHDIQGSSLENEPAQTPSFTANVRLIAQKKDILMLLIVVFFMGLMYGVLSSFLTLNLFNLSGGNAQIVGIAIMCETASELPAFFFSHAIIQKLGTVKVLLVSITAYALRITWYASMTNAWSAIPFEFLHGCTFGLAWSACTQYIYSAAPKGTEGTLMGLLNATQNGLARAVGTLIGGYFYEQYGARTMWIVTDMGVPVALVGVAMFAYLKQDTQVVEEQEALLEEADLFSPHSGNPQSLVEPRPSYEEVK